MTTQDRVFQDHVMPEGKWEFDATVAAVFDEMLARSIPAYREMRWATNQIGCQFLKFEGTDVIDIGASRGEAVDWFITNYPHRKYHLIEISEPMRAELKARYKDEASVRIYDDDLRSPEPIFRNLPKSALVISALTLMFVPIEYRQRVVSAIYENLLPGGALLLVEKMLGDDRATNDLLNVAYYAMKAANGYSEEEITRKRLSLEGVLVPLSETWNRQLLTKAGFRSVECYWRSLQFAGFVAIK